MGVTWILVRGVRESAEVNTTMVIIKMAAIVIFPFSWRTSPVSVTV